MSESGECDARAWREVGRDQTMWRFYGQREELHETLYELEKALEAGEPVTRAHIEAARKELDTTRQLVEEFAKLADDTEPWDGGAGATTPYSVFRGQLEDAGYEVIPPGASDDGEVDS